LTKSLSGVLASLAARKRRRPPPPPLLFELLEDAFAWPPGSYGTFPFRYMVRPGPTPVYRMGSVLDQGYVVPLRAAVMETSASLDPDSVAPLTFERLIDVLRQDAAGRLPTSVPPDRAMALSELVAYECVGLSRVLGLAKDDHLSEFFVDSEVSPIYLDHDVAGRCETSISLTERERGALETHLDLFRGYSLDFRNPSMKNDIEVSGARLRVSLDLEPLSVNRFALDVRRLNLTTLGLPDLAAKGVLTWEAGVLLVGWVESGGNLSIVGETGTGKTTLLNAIDEQVKPGLRRVYIEDAVETRDLLDRGFHQLKLKVDPLDRKEEAGRTKEDEVVKVLHRSPDLVVLSEIQSEAHSRAFFHALSAGAKGLQTFHASTVEQALRRWTSVQGIPEESILDLGVIVQMSRPDRLSPARNVTRICQVVGERGEPSLREIFVRNGAALARVPGGGLEPPAGVSGEVFEAVTEGVKRRMGAGRS
jgi:type IV secretory pathway ATPase VirB11/archaellum biosynthesis ATPase